MSSAGEQSSQHLSPQTNVLKRAKKVSQNNNSALPADPSCLLFLFTVECSAAGREQSLNAETQAPIFSFLNDDILVLQELRDGLKARKRNYFCNHGCYDSLAIKVIIYFLPDLSPVDRHNKYLEPFFRAFSYFSSKLQQHFVY